MIDYDKCKGVEDVLEPAALMLSIIQTAVQTSLLDRKMAEYAQQSVMDAPHFHIALVQDISPNCDCHGENDAPILPDIECLQALTRLHWIRHVQMPV